MKTLLFTVISASILLLTGCGGPSLADLVKMEVSMEPTEIVVNTANGLQAVADISWSITNNSDQAINYGDYELSLGASRVEETTMEVLSTLKRDIAPGATETGKYRHYFSARANMDGDYNLIFSLMEIVGENSGRQIQQVSIPFTQHWEK